MNTQVVGLEAEGRLRGLIVASSGATDSERLAADALFICIGGMPRTDGAADLGLMFDAAGYIKTVRGRGGVRAWFDGVQELNGERLRIGAGVRQVRRQQHQRRRQAQLA